MVRWILSLEAAAFGTAALVHAGVLALLGTLVGIFTIAIGVGPRTALDLLFHAGIVGGLIVGLVLVARGTTGARSQQA